MALAAWKKRLSAFWSDEEGQTTTEYILILAIVVMVALKFRAKFGSSLSTILDRTEKNMIDATNPLDQ